MKKFSFRLLCVFMCMAMIFSFADLMTSAKTEPTIGGFTAEDMLKTKGTKIVNQNGKRITLKGINLGGWLIHEKWFCPVNADDNSTTMDVLTQRFGQEKAYNLINQYEDNWITESDLDNIVELGFNCVRVPFWYRNFYYDDNGTKILDENGDWNFSRLDWVIKECNERRLYVILDCHGAVGYQNNSDNCGKINACNFYGNSNEAEKNRQLTCELWTALATRYKDNPTVAMYDLINEPMCNVSPYETKEKLALIGVYDKLYDAVRKVDNKHIITIEAIWQVYNLPMPIIMGWSNVVYQLHLYDQSDKDYFKNLLISKLWPHNVPIYVGEFKPLGTAKWDTVFSLIKLVNYSWSMWTYKGFSYDANGNDWYIYGSTTDDGRVDVYNDSYETIMQKWDSRLRTNSGNYKFTGLQNIVKPYV